MSRGRKAKDLTGRLVVVERLPNRVSKSGDIKVMWRCLCDCGNETITRTYCLLHGETKSCGCLQKEIAAKHLNNYRPKHGGSKERLYRVWIDMRNRCSNKQNKNYGERGISVCKEWEDYSKFQKWAFDNGYDQNAPKFQMTLDRIDPNGNYEPSNCRFANSKEQNNNKRNNRYITYKNETLTVSQWADKLGISYCTMRYRLTYWPISKALEMTENCGYKRETV